MSASSLIVLHLGEQVELARLLERVLELEVAVEVVLDGALAAAGDDEDVGEPGRDRLLHHVLDRRLVDDRQHLLRLALRGREEPRAETGGGDDRLLHRLLSSGHGARRYPSARGALVADVGRLVALVGRDRARAPRPSPAGAGSTGDGATTSSAITEITMMSPASWPASATAIGNAIATVTDAIDALCVSARQHDPQHGHRRA